MIAFVLSYELFWNPSCKTFMKPKSVLNDSMSRTVPDEQMMHGFIACHPWNIQDSLSACLPLQWMWTGVLVVLRRGQICEDF
jgi:hypothetical protein